MITNKEKRPGFFQRLKDKKRKRIEDKARMESQLAEIKPIAENTSSITQQQHETKNISIGQRLEGIENKLGITSNNSKEEEKFKNKNFKMPYKVKLQLKKIAKKNKVLVFMLRTNRTIEVTIGELKEGMLIIGKKFYQGDADFIWLLNGKTPSVVLPEWDLRPIGARVLVEDAMNNKRIADPQNIIIRAIEFKEALQPKKFGGGGLIWIILGAAVLFYVLFGGK